MKNDTIVAVATPHGVGGLAVLRISGPDALPLALRHLSVRELPPRKAVYCRYEELDDVVTLFLPRGYTGEPTVEISCHGSLYLQQALLKSLLDDGARLAEPGEYTLRAFRSGRLNLSQAEAVADLIDAATPAQHQLAVSQLRGGYAKELQELRQQLLDLTSLLELELDFSQEDVEFADRSHLMRLVEHISLRINLLRGTFHMGNALKRGIPTAIIGRPNAGKSSLLNALLADDRAIVSPIAGTTRDTVEETFTIDGITFRLVDTAGLHHTDDPLEYLGIQRAIEAAVRADIILYVHDATQPWVDAIDDMQSLQDRGVDLNRKHKWIVANKIDLAPNGNSLPGFLPVSSKEGTGLEALRKVMVKTVSADLASASDTLLTNARHYEALGRADAALAQVAAGLSEGIPADLVAVDLRDALYHLGTITGDVTSDEVLGNIFSRFCVGK